MNSTDQFAPEKSRTKSRRRTGLACAIAVLMTTLGFATVGALCDSLWTTHIDHYDTVCDIDVLAAELAMLVPEVDDPEGIASIESKLSLLESHIAMLRDPDHEHGMSKRTQAFVVRELSELESAARKVRRGLLQAMAMELGGRAASELLKMDVNTMRRESRQLRDAVRTDVRSDVGRGSIKAFVAAAAAALLTHLWALKTLRGERSIGTMMWRATGMRRPVKTAVVEIPDEASSSRTESGKPADPVAGLPTVDLDEINELERHFGLPTGSDAHSSHASGGDGAVEEPAQMHEAMEASSAATTNEEITDADAFLAEFIDSYANDAKPSPA